MVFFAALRHDEENLIYPHRAAHLAFTVHQVVETDTCA